LTSTIEEDDELTTVQDDSEVEIELESNSAKEEVFKSILESRPQIVEQIKALTVQEHPCLVIDYDYLLDNQSSYFDINSNEFVKNVKLLGGAALQIYMDYHNNEKLEFETRVRISDPHLVRPLRSISTKDINKGVVVSTGTINSVSEKKSAVIEKVGMCSNCDYEGVVEGGRKCPNCGESGTFKMRISKSKLTDYQFLEVQESSNESSSLPISYTLKLYGPDMVLKFQPGDNIQFSGVVKLEKANGPQQQQPTDEEFSQDLLYDLVIEALYVEKLGKETREKVDKLSKKDIEYIQRLRKDHTDKTLTELLVSQFASHIYGEDIIKEVLLIVLASPSMLHVLLVGSPSTGKTQMARFAVKVSPVGMFSAGKGSSGVGLTASTIPDKNGVMKLNVGPVVLADGGVVGVDELDKIPDNDKYYLLESMEDGTVTVAKGGINATLNARTSIVACANPVGGHYDEYKNLVDNVKIPVPLLTRFDLIHILKDKPNKERDTEIVKHIGKVFSKTSNNSDPQKQQELDFLRKYFKYIKTVLPPTQNITEEVTTLMEEYYPKLRQSGVESSTTTITPRQAYGLYTIAVARSRLLLKDKVEKSDIDRAISIMSEVMGAAGIDVNTGKVDVGIMYKTPLKKLSDKLKIMEVINSLSKGGSEPVPRGMIIDSLIRDAGVPEFKASELFEKLYQEGGLMEPKAGYFVLNR
jgi:replicative DNA helicase Mcm